MIGHAVGDALGVPVEFCDREKLIDDPITDMVGYGTYPVPVGAWSDDTSMSLCALDALCDKVWSWDKIMNNFAEWLEEGRFTPTGEAFDVGRTCLDAIIKYIRDNIPARECGCDGEYSNGNGSLMRIHPFVLYAHAKSMPLAEWTSLVDDGSKITHAHERSRLGCLIYSFVLLALLEDQSRAAVELGLGRAEKALSEWDEMSHYKRLFEQDFASLHPDEIKSSGYVVDTLEAALWCLLTTESFRDCVLKAVNLGEDTDTVAAVAGGLAGALYGYDAIPSEWKNTLINRERIEEMCVKACESWI
jgi:ADP-ribosylglycohydrolase